MTTLRKERNSMKIKIKRDKPGKYTVWFKGLYKSPLIGLMSSGCIGEIKKFENDLLKGDVSWLCKSNIHFQDYSDQLNKGRVMHGTLADAKEYFQEMANSYK